MAIASYADASSSAQELFADAQRSYEAHSYQSALSLFRQAAELGNPEAQYMAGLMFYRGEGSGASNATLAAKYYRMAAEQNFAKAQYNLAVLHYQGQGVPRDDESAYKWLYLASLHGESRALEMIPVASRNLSQAKKESAMAQVEAFVKHLEFKKSESK